MRRTLLLLLCACGSSSETQTPGEVTVTITTPTVGEEMLAADHPTIVVTGTVATTNPDYGTLEAFVNGTRVDIGAGGAFSAELDPVVGVNHVKVEAGDGIDPLVGRELDVMWAPEYLPPIAGTTGFDLQGALELQLGQLFFDGRLFGSTLDLSPDPVVAHDLGAALELILWHIDLASLLADGIHFGSGSSTLDISIPTATPAGIVVDAKVVHDPMPSIELAIDLNGVFLQTTGTFHFGARNLVIAGGIAADMHASARLALGMATDGTIQVTASNITAVVGPLVPQFTGGDGDELNAFITIGNNDFRQLVEGLISSQLIPTFTDKVPPLLEQLLGATDKLLDDVNFTLDATLGTPVTLQLDGKVGALDVAAGPAIGTNPGHVTVRQDLAIRTTGEPIHTTSRGAVRIDANPVRPPTNTSAVHLMMKQDFLNALLHSLWNGGLLEGATTAGGISAQVSAKLAPVIVPTPPESSCTIDGERCDVLLQLGQVDIGLADFEQSFGVNAVAGARIIVDGNTVSIKIQEIPEVHVWETSPEHGLLTPIAVHDLIVNVVWPELFGAIGDNLSITLPIPDLAALGLDTLSPALANAELRLKMRARPTVTAGYIGLGADFELETPQP